MRGYSERLLLFCPGSWPLEWKTRSANRDVELPLGLGAYIDGIGGIVGFCIDGPWDCFAPATRANWLLT